MLISKASEQSNLVLWNSMLRGLDVHSIYLEPQVFGRLVHHDVMMARLERDANGTQVRHILQEGQKKTS